MLPTIDGLKALPVFAPLLAAVIAPLSTLLDIPALAEPWFFQHEPDSDNVTKLPDPRTNITLSAVGLAFNVLANALLIFRFSFGIAFGNILAYGVLTRNTPGISYGEGFWCALMSVVLAFVIVALLVCHYLTHVRGKKHPTTDNQLRVRVAGRHFMLQNTLFVLTIGLLALFMSRLEAWTYLQGIYFSVVAILTVGFGDFYPTKASTQIGLFPFVLIGIVQLASLIDLLVRFFRGRLTSRRAERRRAFEKKRQEEEDQLAKEPDLARELQFLRKLYHETDHWRIAQDLVANCTGFLLFWVLGAVIFSQIEGWTYGQGLYFCYVFFFTIGFGDYAPVTPAGRVVFIVYSLFAVPIMASFAVQTIQSVFQKFSLSVLRKNEAKAGIGEHAVEGQAMGEANGIANAEDEEKGLPQDVRDRLRKNKIRRNFRRTHTEYVMAGHKRIESQLLLNGSGQNDENENTDRNAEEGAEESEREREREEDRILTEFILELAVELERRARRLLLGHMEEGSRARMLLKADRIVQLRNIKALAIQVQANENESEHSDDLTVGQPLPTTHKVGRSKVNAMMQKYYEEETELIPFPTDLGVEETLEEVARYREAFAGLLAAGSRLLKLKNEEKYLFERRYWRGSKEEG